MCIKLTTILTLAVFSVGGGCHAASPPKPYNIIFDTTAACFLGGVDNKQWVTASNIIRQYEKSNAPFPMTKQWLKQNRPFPDDFVSIQMDGTVSQFFAGASYNQLGEDGYCQYENTIFFNTKYSQAGFIILTNTGEEVTIPKLQFLDNSSRVYQNVVRELLTSKGLVDPKIEIAQIIKVDLQSDGVDEVLISARYLSSEESAHTPDGFPDFAKAGDYSIVILRQVIDGEVSTQIIKHYIFDQSKKKAGRIPKYPVQYYVTGIMDYNHDGVLEIVISAGVHKGDYAALYEYHNGQFRKRLFCACGTLK